MRGTSSILGGHLPPFCGHDFLDYGVCLHSECELLVETWEVFYVGIGSAGVVGGYGQPDVLWMGKFVCHFR